MAELRVLSFSSLSDVAPMRGEIDALNLASRRPCPFATFDYLRAFTTHDEYARADDALLFLTFHEGERLVGYLPLRRRVERLFGLQRRRIGLLVDHDTDRPHLVARAEDEARCCDAAFRHLVRDPGWTFLEFAFQDADSGLSRPPPLPAGRFHARHFENMPNTTVPLGFGGLEEYYRTLSKSQRRRVARMGRRLLAAGEVAFLSSADPRARLALLDLYLDVEARSWKRPAGAGISRAPRRLAFFRELAGTGQPLGMHFDFLLLGGAPIAGLVSGDFDGCRHGLETAFDQAFETQGPGLLLWMLSVRRALQDGVRRFNLDGNYAYYKAKWGGTVTPTRAVQVFRVPSLHWAKARGGALLRRLRGAAPGPADFNPERRGASGGEDAEETAEAPGLPGRAEERERARLALDALEACGARVDRLAGADLASALSFLAPHRAP